MFCGVGSSYFDSKALLHYYGIIHSEVAGGQDHDQIDSYHAGASDVSKRRAATSGIRPGEKIELDLLPGGRGMLKAARLTGTIEGFVGLLEGRTKKVATIEEIKAATAQGWAGKK